MQSHDVLEFADGRTVELYSRPQKVADAIVRTDLELPG